jgi:hypothetical protein
MYFPSCKDHELSYMMKMDQLNQRPMVYDALLEKCIDDSLLSYHD